MAALLLAGPMPAHAHPVAGTTFPTVEVTATVDRCGPGADHAGGCCVVAPGCVAAHATCCVLPVDPSRPFAPAEPRPPWRSEPVLAGLILTPPLPPPIV